MSPSSQGNRNVWPEGSAPQRAGEAKVLAYMARFALLLALLCQPLAAPGVVNGIVDPNTPDSPWTGVGSISVRGGTFTAVLVAGDLALTAAHVVAGVEASEVVFNVNGDGDLAQRIPAAELIVHPDFRGLVGLRPSAENDLALVRLATPVDAFTAVYGLFDGDVPAGAVITFVGYGAAGDGVSGVTIDGNPAVKRVGHNVAECFAWTLEAENCGVTALTGLGPRALYLFDFDAPGSGSALLAGEATLAGGDSGSPMFVRIGDVWQLAGVNTFVTRLQGQPQGVHGTAGGGVLLTNEHRLWIRGHVRTRAAPTTSRLGDTRALGIPATAWVALAALGGGLVGCAAFVSKSRATGTGLRRQAGETKR